MKRHICIHGHFYQPPRENAWLEEIEFQESAAPYHDWNERVGAESYAPNSASRILDREDRIIDIINNYARISFDAGPTLLTWMARSAPDIHQAIVEADRESRTRFHGHGGAMAQAYNHLIMPLAQSRDKRTQILWGLRDFESRFGRKAEGLWLPETAVDLESLDLAAEQGVAFTILSPYQAARSRTIGSREWVDASHGAIDPRRPYLCHLPSGRTIALFFYDGPISHDIAFGHILRNGEDFANRLLGAFTPDPASDELVHVATDGETYGHHHRFGDMALAYCLRHIEENRLAEITVYADYLERFPPAQEVEIAKNTAWSCGHGVERWRSDCGDSSGMHPRWNQKWRTPLRQAMDWLRDQMTGPFEQALSGFGADPWAVRNDYISVILDRSPRAIESFMARNIKAALSPQDKTRLLKLLEIQRHAMLIFTSDGWFFDDISNVETVQVVQYAARAIQLHRDVTGADLEPAFIAKLAAAKSNVPAYKDGARVFDRFVRPSIIDFPRLAAHYGVSSLFEEYPQAVKIAHYEASAETCDRESRGRKKLALGRVRLKSEITWEERTISHAVLHGGGQDLTAGIRGSGPRRSIPGHVRRDPGGLRPGRHDQGPGPHRPALRGPQLFALAPLQGRAPEGRLRYPPGQPPGPRRRLPPHLRDQPADHGDHGPDPDPLPETLLRSGRLRPQRRVQGPPRGPGHGLRPARGPGRGVPQGSLEPGKAGLGFEAEKKIEALMAGWANDPGSPEALRTVARLLAVLKPMEIDIDLWKSQNLYVSKGRRVHADQGARADRGDSGAKAWLEAFEAAGQSLRVSPAVFERS